MKLEGIYQGFLCLGIMFMAVATFLYVCLLGYCDEKWASINELLCLFSEVFLFVWMVSLIKKGSRELKETESPRAVTYLCEKIRNSTVYAMGYSGIQLFLPEVDIHIALIYGANIFLVASFFFVWMTMKINNIERGGAMENYYY